jgi:transcriptional regulator of aromatic amino acid metabolism
MPRTGHLGTLTKLLNQSNRPIYVVDGERRIIYCNPALANWLDLERARIVGRLVEFHSELGGTSAGDEKTEVPLTELCPPPRALYGEPCVGTISCLARSGSLAHRRAEFVPLEASAGPAEAATRSRRRPTGAVLVALAVDDMTPIELGTTFTGDLPVDELHRTIRQFRRVTSTSYSIEAMLGGSTRMKKVRAQLSAAATSGANCLVYGPRGSGRGHVARAIHYYGGFEPSAKLIPIECASLSDDLLRRALDAVRHPSEGRHRHTLLLENLEGLTAAHQAELQAASQSLSSRIIGTLCDLPAALMENAFLDALSTITIHVPPLAERMEDLPLLAQSFLESRNRGSDKQIGSIRRDALDLLALHSWPGELDELRGVIAAAHRVCTSHEICPADLPPVVHHAAQAAARAPRRPERIVLDELLATVEKEAIARAMNQAADNKSVAADLLGMSRPRLYRRLIQLGLVTEAAPEELEMPEFIEQDPEDGAA